jgi:DNA helicase-2/ATP-dependent DNA helicase PcrA
MSAATPIHDDHVDDHVDDEIAAYLNLERATSFFLFAGAGSGKTRSLVTALGRLRETYGNRMRLLGKRVGVVTYTNAAVDEIKSRLDFDPLISVSTIHSFVWDLIAGFNADIRGWLQKSLSTEIDELKDQLTKGKPGTKIAIERARSIEAKQRRLDALPAIQRFVYSPNGENRTRDSLNHSEVIKIGADFLMTKPLMQKILVSGYPIVLVDESQDTNRLLMDALLAVQGVHRDCFGLGLFGDTMQRIYSDGKVDLGKKLPEDWKKPAKVMNHRCPRRVVGLINKIRSSVDHQIQTARSDAGQGHVRLFISEHKGTKDLQVEARARERMSEMTADPHWAEPDQVKTLTLEHHMAAKRMGFLEMFEPLDQIDDFKTGLRDGTLPFLRFFSELILPLVKAKRAANDFAATAVVRKWSPLLSTDTLEAAGANQLLQMRKASSAVGALMDVCAAPSQPSFIDVLRCVAKSELFEVPDILYPFTSEENQHVDAEDNGASKDEDSRRLDALRKFLSTPWAQLEHYAKYAKGEAPFGTHQGVKGREFPRVLVVMDDEEARGFLFSYDKLFGAREKTKSDLSKEAEGEETAIDRTRRLFYVTCSRAQQSLAIVAYTGEPNKVREYAIHQGWFDTSEVELLK